MSPGRFSCTYPYHNGDARALGRVGLARRCRHRPPRAPRRRKVGRPDRPLVPLKAGHPRTPMPPTLRGFWHAHEPPRRRVSTHETHSRSCAPTIVPWVDPLGMARLPRSRTCGRSPKPHLSLPPGSDLHPQPRSLYVPVPYRPRRITRRRHFATPRTFVWSMGRLWSPVQPQKKGI